MKGRASASGLDIPEPAQSADFLEMIFFSPEASTLHTMLTHYLSWEGQPGVGQSER